MPYKDYSNKFNRGEVSADAIYRTDVEKIKDSSRKINNFLPMRLGGAQYRPGLEYIGDMAFTGSSDDPYLVPFVKSLDETAIIEFNRGRFRIWDDGDDLVTIPTVSTALLEGYFTTAASNTDWVKHDVGTAISTWSSGDQTMKFTNQSGDGEAKRFQSVSTGGDSGTSHTLDIVIYDGPIHVAIGDGTLDDETHFSGVLKPGYHFLTFTPGANFGVTFTSKTRQQVRIDQCAVHLGGILTIVDYSNDLIPTDVRSAKFRYVQSLDVIYFASETNRNFAIERRGDMSWSLVPYRPDVGPFGPINTTDITLDPTGLNGVIDIVASRSYFTSDHEGGVIRMISEGQERRSTLSAFDAATDSVRVLGVDNGRDIFVSLQGSFVATVVLEQSVDEVSWTTVATYTSNTTTIYNDGYENANLYYRLRVSAYTSGSVVTILRTSGGSVTGIAKIISVTSATQVKCNVIEALGSAQATEDWYISEWHETGFPTAVTIHEGRLWWFGKGKYWGSVADQYDFYDEFLIGDERSISGTIGIGAADVITWATSVERLVMGMISDEPVLKSNSFGDPITSSNRNVKRGSGRGAAPVDMVHVDGRTYFVQAGGKKLMELEYAVGGDRYNTNDLTTLNPDITGDATIIRLAVTTEPDTRIWCVLSDGTVAVLLIDRAENVLAWSHIDTRRYLNNGSDTIEDIVVLPAVGEDRVYFITKRIYNTIHNRFLERMARFDEMTYEANIANSVIPQFDSFSRHTSPGLTITGLSRLEGATVSYWADGDFESNVTVLGGSITLNSDSYTDVIVGAGYDAEIQLSVIQYDQEPPLMTHKRVVSTGFIFRDYKPGALQVSEVGDHSIGATANMPDVEDGQSLNSVALGLMKKTYHQEPFGFNGGSQPDPIVKLYATRTLRIMATKLLVDLHNDDTEDIEG